MTQLDPELIVLVLDVNSFTAFHCAKDSARAHPFCQGCQKAWHQSHLLKVIFTDHWLGGLCAARFPSEPKRASEIKKKST